MIVRIGNIKSPRGANKRKKRLGCGPGSGHGKTSGRGHKGQGQHAGSKTYAGFQGGNVPLFRHLPKRGFKTKKREYEVVNLKDIEERFSQGEEVSVESLRRKGLIKSRNVEIKILGQGNISKPLIFKVKHFSRSAFKKIEALGGKVVDD